MSDLGSVQRRWLDAARRHHAPSPQAVRRMQRGLRSRIAAGEPAPAWQLDAPAEPAPPRWRPWVVGGGVLLAAALALLWVSRGSVAMVAQADDNNAAAYDAERSPTAPARAVRPAPRAVQPGVAGQALPAATHPTATHPAATRDDATAAPEPASAAVRPARARSSTTKPATQPPAPSLDVAGEAAVLRRAKSAIDSGSWSAAAEALDDYERRHGSGVLAPEAGALRVIVACGRGASDATARAQRFVDRHPSSPMRERIGRACDLDPR